MQKWCYLTLLALTAAAPEKQATINTIVTANSDETPKPIDQPCNGQPQHDRASALCAQWIAADAGNRSASASEQSALYALLAAIFSAAGIAGLITTLLLTIRANRHASKTAERELRAYVSVSPDLLVGEHDSSGAIQYHLTTWMHNQGSTPAYDLIHAGNIVAFDSESAKRFFAPNNTEPPTVGVPAPLTIQIGDKAHGEISAHVRFDRETIQELLSGKKTLYAFGLIFYNDTFYKRRITKFCYELPAKEFRGRLTNANANSGKPVEAGWIAAPFHNVST